MQFEVVKANIVNVSADAIILPANEELREGSGTSRAIFEAAGRKTLTKECKKIGHCDMGSAVPTLAYNLEPQIKFIIHAVVPRWIDGDHGEYELLSSAYLTSLNLAEMLRCESIAFPLLAAGNNGFDKTLAIQIAKESIEQFSGENLKTVYLVIFEDNIEILMRIQGFDVTVPPAQLLINEKKAERRAKAHKLFNDGKDVAQNILEEQVQGAIEWLKVDKNREKLIKWGIAIAKRAINKEPPQ